MLSRKPLSLQAQSQRLREWRVVEKFVCSKSETFYHKLAAKTLHPCFEPFHPRFTAVIILFLFFVSINLLFAVQR